MHLETGRPRPSGRRPEIGHHFGNARRVERGGVGVVVGKGQGAGAHHGPAALGFGHRARAAPRAVGAGFAAGVGQLHARHAALRHNEVVDAPQHGHLLIFPQAQVFGTDAAFGRNSRGFLHNEGRAAHGPATQVHEVPVVGKSVLGAVLAHGRHHHAVFEGDAAQGEGFK